jgi:hypothetical protein
VNVAAIIVTRGDVDITPIRDSIPSDWNFFVWDNSKLEDFAVYGRYVAIKYVKEELIYVQDDDCVVSDPEQIVGEWLRVGRYPWDGRPVTDPWGSDPRDGLDHVVCNMPAAFRARHFYDEHSLVGFGACFHRDAPERAFRQWDHIPISTDGITEDTKLFHLTCDIVFTALTPRVLVDVPYEDLPWASAENRMWKQPWHQGIRDLMLELVLKMRNG